MFSYSFQSTAFFHARSQDLQDSNTEFWQDFTCTIMCAVLSRSVISNPLWSHGLKHAKLFCPLKFPGKNTGVGSHLLPQRIFPTQRSGQVSCIADEFFTIWATREAHYLYYNKSIIICVIACLLSDIHSSLQPHRL